MKAYAPALSAIHHCCNVCFALPPYLPLTQRAIQAADPVDRRQAIEKSQRNDLDAFNAQRAREFL
jgi:hypothetical protein